MYRWDNHWYFGRMKSNNGVRMLLIRKPLDVPPDADSEWPHPEASQDIVIPDWQWEEIVAACKPLTPSAAPPS